MAITHFQPEIWAAQLLATLQKELVYASSVCANRDYEGEIATKGDTVHINAFGAPTIVDYTKDTDLTIEVLTDAELTLLIDQQKAFAFEVDDIDKRQVANGGAVMNQSAIDAAYGLRDVADQFMAGRMVLGASPTNTIGLVDGTTVANVYDKLIVPTRTKMKRANIPTAGRYMTLAPEVTEKLLLDPRFVKVNESGSDQALVNGMLGRIGGFDILESNNAPTPNRSITATITVATTAKTMTGAAGSFTQGDVGLTVAGTRITASSKIVSVSADGTVATMDTAGASAGTQTDTVLSGGGYVAIAGHRIATSYAEQIAKVEAFRPEKRFADALKGLHLYGGKVVRPSGLVVANVKVI